MHSTVIKFSLSRCLSRTTLSNTIANNHMWLFKFKLIPSSKSWESVKELGGSIALFGIPTCHIVTGNCGRFPEKGVGGQGGGRIQGP